MVRALQRVAVAMRAGYRIETTEFTRSGKSVVRFVIEPSDKSRPQDAALRAAERMASWMIETRTLYRSSVMRNCPSSKRCAYYTRALDALEARGLIGRGCRDGKGKWNPKRPYWK